MKQEFINKLKDLNINSYEAKIWTALLSRGVSTAGELSDISNVPRSRSYDVLESLEKKGFIVMKIGKPIKYIAVPPKEVLERVKKNVKEEADRNVKTLEEIKNTEILDDLTKLHEQGVEMVEPSDITGALKGRDNLNNQLIMMIKEAEESIILVTSEEGIKRKTDLLLKHLKKAKERGVNIKISAPLKGFKDLNALKEIAEVKDLELTGRFCIIDSTSVLFMMAHDEDVHPSYDVGIWLNTPFFSNTLTQLFDLSWNLIKIKNK